MGIWQGGTGGTGLGSHGKGHRVGKGDAPAKPPCPERRVMPLTGVPPSPCHYIPVPPHPHATMSSCHCIPMPPCHCVTVASCHHTVPVPPPPRAAASPCHHDLVPPCPRATIPPCSHATMFLCHRIPMPPHPCATVSPLRRTLSQPAGQQQYLAGPILSSGQPDPAAPSPWQGRRVDYVLYRQHHGTLPLQTVSARAAGRGVPTPLIPLP